MIEKEFDFKKKINYYVLEKKIQIDIKKFNFNQLSMLKINFQIFFLINLILNTPKCVYTLFKLHQ